MLVYCWSERKRMQGISPTLKFLTSYELEEQKLIPWGVWVLWLHQSARCSIISLIPDPMFILDSLFVFVLFMPEIIYLHCCETQVYEYLLKTPACNQTRESVTEFNNRCVGFKLTDADKQNIINCRPSSVAGVYGVLPCLFC